MKQSFLKAQKRRGHCLFFVFPATYSGLMFYFHFVTFSSSDSQTFRPRQYKTVSVDSPASCQLSACFQLKIGPCESECCSSGPHPGCRNKKSQQLWWIRVWSVTNSDMIQSCGFYRFICRAGRPASPHIEGVLSRFTRRPFCGLVVAAGFFNGGGFWIGATDSNTLWLWNKQTKKTLQLVFVEQERDTETAQLFVCSVSISAAPHITPRGVAMATGWRRGEGGGCGSFDTSLWGFQPVNLNEAACVPVCLGQDWVWFWIDPSSVKRVVGQFYALIFLDIQV